jgi:hypothetical protein
VNELKGEGEKMNSAQRQYVRDRAVTRLFDMALARDGTTFAAECLRDAAELEAGRSIHPGRFTLEFLALLAQDTFGAAATMSGGLHLKDVEFALASEATK